MSPEEMRAYVEKHFFRPIRRNNLMSGIISVLGLMVFLLWLVMVNK